MPNPAAKRKAQKAARIHALCGIGEQTFRCPEKQGSVGYGFGAEAVSRLIGG